MAKRTLPTNYKDDVLATSMGGKRRYNLIQNGDGTISLEDVTEYTQEGDNYGAAQLNATNAAVNESADKNNIIDSLDGVLTNTQDGMIAGAKALAQSNKDLSNKLTELNGKTENILQFKAFTKVARVSGSSSAQIITLADLQKIFPGATDKNSGAFAINGDGVATDAHFDGVVWKDNALYVTFNKMVNTQIRISGFVYYSPQEVPQW